MVVDFYFHSIAVLDVLALDVRLLLEKGRGSEHESWSDIRGSKRRDHIHGKVMAGVHLGLDVGLFESLGEE